MLKQLTKISFILVAVLLFVKCSNHQYLIAKEQVGNITSKTSIEDLKRIFKNDSIVQDTSNTFRLNDEKKYEIFTKKGEKIITINFSKEKDSIFKPSNIYIYSNKYKTAKGISINATFNDIRKNYTINKVESSFSSLVLFVDELNATISIEKSKVANPNSIKLEEIPDSANVKSFALWFE